MWRGIRAEAFCGMSSPGCFVSFIFVVWFCLLLFMQGCWVIEFFSAWSWSLDEHSSMLGEIRSNVISFKSVLKGFFCNIWRNYWWCVQGKRAKYHGFSFWATKDNYAYAEIIVCIVSCGGRNASSYESLIRNIENPLRIMFLHRKCKTWSWISRFNQGNDDKLKGRHD